jgi:hypothetical protein
MYVVSVSNHRRLKDGWVCGLAKKLLHVTLPENTMNCNCIVDYRSLLVFKKVYALYFIVAMNCYLLIRSYMIISIAVIIMFMMLLCPYFVFIDTSLSLNMWTWLSVSAFAWGQVRSKLGGVDMSILHHVLLLLFIMFLVIITLCGLILMPFLS